MTTKASLARFTQLVAGALTTVMIFSILDRQFPANAQTGDTPATQDVADPVQVVRDLSELRPQTSSERARADLFDPSLKVFGNLSEILERGGGGRSLPHRGGIPAYGNAVGFGLEQPPGAQDLLRLKVCSSDAVLIGRAETRRAFSTKSETWLFTDYMVNVERWLRPEALPRPITVSAPGGQVIVGTTRITVSQGRPLPVLGLRQSYLLFLKNIENTDSFQLTPETPVKMGTEAEQTQTENVEFVRSIAAIAQTCSQTGK